MNDDLMTRLDQRGRAAGAAAHTAVAEHPIPDFDPDLVRVSLDDDPSGRATGSGTGGRGQQQEIRHPRQQPEQRQNGGHRRPRCRRGELAGNLPGEVERDRWLTQEEADRLLTRSSCERRASLSLHHRDLT